MVDRPPGCTKTPRVPQVPFRSLLHADSGAEILRLLADTARAELGADGVAVVEVLPSGEAKVVQARDLPELAATWRADVDVIDGELGERLLAASGGRFAAVCTLPMMSGGDLFGALVLFFTMGDPERVPQTPRFGRRSRFSAAGSTSSAGR